MKSRGDVIDFIEGEVSPARAHRIHLPIARIAKFSRNLSRNAFILHPFINQSFRFYFIRDDFKRDDNAMRGNLWRSLSLLQD